jgi:hypothetical protein
MSAEHDRLEEARRGIAWRQWGPYLSERQWGTVREDYSDDGNAWDYFSHDQARLRAYRWGEDGLAGISEDKQRLCFALALWNGADPILKERLFGLTNREGNHGEDVKEYYYYLDSTPTHSYMRWLYKYPQRAFPYDELVRVNRERGRGALEYELIDTGVFDADRYFDVEVEYAKASPQDLLIRITVHNRGPLAAPLHVLPTLWLRNTWSWGPPETRGALRAVESSRGATVAVEHPELGVRCWRAAGRPALLFTENESNAAALWQQANPSPFVKDAFHRYVVHGETAAVNPAAHGTKAAAYYALEVAPGESAVLRLRLSDGAPSDAAPFGADFDALVAERRGEADAFYAAVAPASAGDDEKQVLRQALAGMLWSKQHYYFDLDRWLDEHAGHPLTPNSNTTTRNRNWFHMLNDDVISMPDKWEYPWFAAWDLAFHCVALASVDIDFAKQQLDLMLRDIYLHPSGQMPAYEWNFGDVNPPVHAWATMTVYHTEKALRGGKGDIPFLKSAFQRLLVNFTWWVNRKDPTGRNVFEGGFLGLDNIGVFDRSAPLPTGGTLEQADGTAWMALFAQNMLEIALELALDDPSYSDLALKFAEHFLWIAAAMDRPGENHDEMWDDGDGFFYDLLRFPDGRAERLKVRSMVGLLPLCATTVFEADIRERFPQLTERLRGFLWRHPEVVSTIAPVTQPGVADRRLLAVLDEPKLRRVLGYLLDENEFLSPFGIRALSRVHRDHPYRFDYGGDEWRVSYEPAESSSGLFGGNSNWRGPIWMPVNLLILRALTQFYAFYGDQFRVECPTGSGKLMTLYEVTIEISKRLISIFTRGADGRRPVFGGVETFQRDPHWRDHVLFYEYFHGDNGAGLGASHQTGWTGVVARLIQAVYDHDRVAMLAAGPREGIGVLRTRTKGKR